MENSIWKKYMVAHKKTEGTVSEVLIKEVMRKCVCGQDFLSAGGLHSPTLHNPLIQGFSSSINEDNILSVWVPKIIFLFYIPLVR